MVCRIRIKCEVCLCCITVSYFFVLAFVIFHCKHKSCRVEFLPFLYSVLAGFALISTFLPSVSLVLPVFLPNLQMLKLILSALHQSESAVRNNLQILSVHPSALLQMPHKKCLCTFCRRIFYFIDFCFQGASVNQIVFILDFTKFEFCLFDIT